MSPVEKAQAALQHLEQAEEKATQVKDHLIAADEYAWLIATAEKLQLHLHDKVKVARRHLEELQKAQVTS